MADILVITGIKESCGLIEPGSVGAHRPVNKQLRKVLWQGKYMVLFDL